MKSYGRPLNDAVKVKPGEKLQEKPKVDMSETRDILRRAAYTEDRNRGRSAGSKDEG